jgi:hypothetical protein
MTYDAKRFLYKVRERKECLVEFESIILHLRKVKQVTHQVLHDLGIEHKHFHSVDLFY